MNEEFILFVAPYIGGGLVVGFLIGFALTAVISRKQYQIGYEDGKYDAMHWKDP